MKIVVKLRANRGKIVHFNSVYSEIIERKFTKFVHDVAGLLPFTLLNAA